MHLKSKISFVILGAALTATALPAAAAVYRDNTPAALRLEYGSRADRLYETRVGAGVGAYYGAPYVDGRTARKYKTRRRASP
jgi:hypothetical protein